MRFAALFVIAAALCLVAWATLPTAYFVGRVLSTAKVSDVSFHTNSAGGLERTVSASSTNGGNNDRIPHLEIWKAEVKVEKIGTESSGFSTNLTGRVFVYYDQDSSTNYVTPYGVVAGRPPRLRLATNAVYSFVCGRADLAAGDTNALQAFSEGIKPR